MSLNDDDNYNQTTQFLTCYYVITYSTLLVNEIKISQRDNACEVLVRGD